MDRRLWLLAALLTAASGYCAETADTLVKIADVRALTRDEAAEERPVHVRGVITWLEFPNMVIQDDSGGAWVHILEARRRGLISPDETVQSEFSCGTDVEVTGISTPGGYATIILPKTLTIHGSKSVPNGHPIDPRQFFAGSEAGERVEVHGVIQAVESVTTGWQLVVNSDFGQFPVMAMNSVLEQPVRLLDAEVRLRGVAASLFNGRRELIGPRLLCGSPGDILIEKEAPPPEAVPLVPLNELMGFSPQARRPHRVRVRGTVTLSVPGEFVYLQHDDRAVRVETTAMAAFTKGDEVEMIGFVQQRSFIAMLVGAEGRRIGRSSVPPPVSISPQQIIEINSDSKNRGLPAKPYDFDGHLVQFTARLLAAQRELEHNSDSLRLVLDAGGMILTAEIVGPGSQELAALLPESVLQVTGIVHLDFPNKILPTNRMHAQRLDVYLRDATDITALETPSWWTPERLALIMAVGGLVLLGALIWVWQLRRQVSRKTHELAAEMRARRDSAIEFDATMRERNRLAANLHDTLLQTMSGLAYQLEACESESVPREHRAANHLETARRMVQRGQEDLRGTVWALRVLPLKGRTFADALRTIVERMQEGHPVRISVEHIGAIVTMTEFVAGNLLLVAQEAINNALKHAQASNISVTLAASADAGQITLEVRDDGVGFNPASPADGSANHFGLLGMRERVERLGGDFAIESQPGNGTCVRLHVPLRDFDKELL